MLAHLLCNAPSSNGLTILCDTIEDALATLETAQLATTQEGTTRPFSSYKIVIQQWRQLPPQESLMKDLLGQMAQIALSLWPGWYGLKDLSIVENFASTCQADRPVQPLLHHLQQIAPSQLSTLSLTWLQTAANCCRHGKLPLLQQFPNDMQLAQLAAAIDPNQLIILLAVDDPTPQPYHLYGLARVLLWLRQATPIPISLLLPFALTEHVELESVLYGAVPLPSMVPTPVEESETIAFVEQKKGVIWPIQGKPHPFSPGERRLAARLAQDAELASLFQCNALVRTTLGSSYLVDLLWPAGQVVVEVDGYGIHSKRSAFQADRHRDYELLISGYYVLRLSHDEVMQDVVLVVEKIRDVVHFRQKKRL